MASNNIGSKVEIAVESDGTTPDPFADSALPLEASDFSALNWAEIPNIGTVGDTGFEQNMTTYDVWGANLSKKTKGIATGRDVEMRCLDESSNGVTAVKAAISITDNNNYAFKITKADGSIEYNVGRVGSLGLSKGGPEDYSELFFTLGINQEPVFA